MTEKSTFVQFPYPSEDEDPWYSNFQNAYLEIDSALFMQKIQNNLFIAGGGFLNLSGNTFTWTQNFVIPIFHYGFKVNVKFGPDSATRQCTLIDGAALVVDIPYALSGNVDVNLEPRSTLSPLAHEQWVMGWRYGSNVYLKGLGKVIP